MRSENTSWRIGITMRVIHETAYTEDRDALAQDWTRLFVEIAPSAVLIPLMNSGHQALRAAQELGLDAVVFSGGNDLGTEASRDTTETLLLDYVLKHRIPSLAVCRGLQLVQRHFGGALSRCDPRTHVAQNHGLTCRDSVLLLSDYPAEVNSFHRVGVEEPALAAGLTAFAISDDGLVEGLTTEDGTLVGVQWHPERDWPLGAGNRRIVQRALGLSPDVSA